MRTFRQFLVETDYDYDFENDPSHIFGPGSKDAPTAANFPPSFRSYYRKREKQRATASKSRTKAIADTPTAIWGSGGSDTHIARTVQQLDQRVGKLEKAISSMSSK